MAQFPLCFSFVLPNEDETPPQYKAVPDPTKSDPDAQAISGINSAFWPNDFALIEAIPQANRGAAVSQFYELHFWNHWLDQMVSNRIAAMAMDSGVNQGQGWAVRFLQGACGASVDGLWGPATIASVNAANLDDAVIQFIALRQARYRQVGGPSLNAWLARAAKIPAFD